MSVFIELPDTEALTAADHYLAKLPIPGVYGGMHRQELALAIQRVANQYITNQYYIYAALSDPLRGHE